MVTVTIVVLNQGMRLCLIIYPIFALPEDLEVSAKMGVNDEAKTYALGQGVLCGLLDLCS